MGQLLYTTFGSVKARLTGKVQFQKDNEELKEGELPTALLEQLICDAETEVENELRSRYLVPFQSKKYGNFEQLPDHTKRAIRVVVDFVAVMKVLDTDFGRGSHVDAEDYYTQTKETYEKHINRLLGRDAIGANDKIDRFKVSPPLDDLLLALHNREADDGFRGRIINTDGNPNDISSYAADQMNDPSRSYVTNRGFRGL
jgi:hypothetical protein